MLISKLLQRAWLDRGTEPSRRPSLSATSAAPCYNAL